MYFLLISVLYSVNICDNSDLNDFFFTCPVWPFHNEKEDTDYT